MVFCRFAWEKVPRRRVTLWRWRPWTIRERLFQCQSPTFTSAVCLWYPHTSYSTLSSGIPTLLFQNVPGAILMHLLHPQVSLGEFELKAPVTIRLKAGGGPVNVTGLHLIGKELWWYTFLNIRKKKRHKYLPFYREITLKWRMLLVQPHRLKTRTCLTRMAMRRTTRTKRSAPSNQQRSRSSEHRQFPGGQLERCTDILRNTNFAPDTGITDGVLRPVDMDVAAVKKSWRSRSRHRHKMLNCHSEFAWSGSWKVDSECVFVWVPNWVLLTLVNLFFLDSY